MIDAIFVDVAALPVTSPVSAPVKTPAIAPVPVIVGLVRLLFVKVCALSLAVRTLVAAISAAFVAILVTFVPIPAAFVAILVTVVPIPAAFVAILVTFVAILVTFVPIPAVFAVMRSVAKGTNINSVVPTMYSPTISVSMKILLLSLLPFITLTSIPPSISLDPSKSLARESPLAATVYIPFSFLSVCALTNILSDRARAPKPKLSKVLDSTEPVGVSPIQFVANSSWVKFVFVAYLHDSLYTDAI